MIDNIPSFCAIFGKVDGVLTQLVQGKLPSMVLAHKLQNVYSYKVHNILEGISSLSSKAQGH